MINRLEDLGGRGRSWRNGLKFDLWLEKGQIQGNKNKKDSERTKKRLH